MDEQQVQEAAPRYNYISPEEYLATERVAGTKSEYLHGMVLAMAGAGLTHNQIEHNLHLELGKLLNGSNCHMLGSNMRVTNPSHDSYMYPDALVYCGEPEMADNQFDTLTNPVVIFEISSPSTGGFDNARKFFYYQEIPSLREYYMIETSTRQVTMVRKQAGKSWLFETTSAGTTDITLPVLGLSLPLDALYNSTGL